MKKTWIFPIGKEKVEIEATNGEEAARKAVEWKNKNNPKAKVKEGKLKREKEILNG